MLANVEGAAIPEIREDAQDSGSALRTRPALGAILFGAM